MQTENDKKRNFEKVDCDNTIKELILEPVFIEASNVNELKDEMSKVENIDDPLSTVDAELNPDSDIRPMKRAKHRLDVLSCDQSEDETKNPYVLSRHKQFKHEGVRYPCDECEYTASTMSSLKLHIKSKHEGVRYPCPECDYTATHPAQLN